MNYMSIIKSVPTLLLALGLTFHVSDAEAKNGKSQNKKYSFKGIVSAIDATSVTVKGKVVTLNAKTKYEDFLGGSTSLEAFKVGDCVKVNLVKKAPATTARKLELESRCRPEAQSTPSPTPQVTPTPNDDGPLHDINDDRGNHAEPGDDSRSGRGRGGNSGRR